MISVSSVFFLFSFFLIEEWRTQLREKKRNFFSFNLVFQIILSYFKQYIKKLNRTSRIGEIVRILIKGFQLSIDFNSVLPSRAVVKMRREAGDCA